MHLSVDLILLVVPALLLASVFASKAASRFGVPALLVFLAMGMLAGSEGPGGIYFDNPFLAQSIGVFALVLILFSGGLSTEWSAIKPVFLRGLSLATLGVLVTAGLVGWFSSRLFGLSPLQGLLLGAIVSSTDAAAVFAVLKARGAGLKRRLEPLVEFESGSNDPMAVLLTVGFIELMQNPGKSAVELCLGFAWQVAVGALVGWGMARAMKAAMTRVKLEYEGLYPVMMLCLALLTYGLTATLRGSGFLAVYLAGIVLARGEFPHKRNVVRFHDGVAWLAQIAMFLVLGLLVFPSQLAGVAVPGMIVCFFLIFVARPAGVFLSLLFARMSFAEKTMVSWAGLRGAAPIILATFPLLAGIPGSQLLFNLVFFTVLLSVLLQGTSISFVARRLGVDAPPEKKIRSPIELEQTEGMDADLVELLVPYGGAAAGRAIHEIGVPTGCLITLVCRDEKFIVALGKTVLEEGDVVLALVREEDKAALQAVIGKMGTRQKE